MVDPQSGLIAYDIGRRLCGASGGRKFGPKTLPDEQRAEVERLGRLEQLEDLVAVSRQYSSHAELGRQTKTLNLFLRVFARA